MDTDLWFNSFGFLSLQNYIASCNFPSWHRAQVFCRWRDSCGFIRSAFPSTLAFVTHKGPLFKNDKCPHAHLLSKKTLAYGIKTGNMFNHYWVWERGWVSVLTQSRYWLCKRVVFGSHIYRKGTMVVTVFFKPGKCHSHPWIPYVNTKEEGIAYQQKSSLWGQFQE